MKKIILILILCFSVNLLNAQSIPSVNYYVSGKTYSANKLVSLDGVIYKSLSSTSDNPEFSVNWEKVGAGSGAASTLQEVTDAGNITTSNIIVGTETTSQELTPTSIVWKGEAGFFGAPILNLLPNNTPNSGVRNITLPAGSGTLAFEGPAANLQEVTDAGDITTNDIILRDLAVLSEQQLAFETAGTTWRFKQNTSGEDISTTNFILSYEDSFFGNGNLLNFKPGHLFVIGNLSTTGVLRAGTTIDNSPPLTLEAATSGKTGSFRMPDANTFSPTLSFPNKDGVIATVDDTLLKTINTSTVQTSTTLNASHPVADFPIGTQVLNTDLTQPYIYTRVSSTEWARSGALTYL